MYKSVNKTKHIRQYMESLGIQIEDPTVKSEDNKFYIVIVKSKWVTPGVKKIDIEVFFFSVTSRHW